MHISWLTINVSLADVLAILSQSNLEIFFWRQFSKRITIWSTIVAIYKVDAVVAANKNTACQCNIKSTFLTSHNITMISVHCLCAVVVDLYSTLCEGRLMCYMSQYLKRCDFGAWLKLLEQSRQGWPREIFTQDWNKTKDLQHQDILHSEMLAETFMIFHQQSSHIGHTMCPIRGFSTVWQTEIYTIIYNDRCNYSCRNKNNCVNNDTSRHFSRSSRDEML